MASQAIMVVAEQDRSMSKTVSYPFIPVFTHTVLMTVIIIVAFTLTHLGKTPKSLDCAVCRESVKDYAMVNAHFSGLMLTHLRVEATRNRLLSTS
jgi:hypothetical protein